MERDENFSASLPGSSFHGLDHHQYPLDQTLHHNQHHQQLMRAVDIGETSGENSNQMVDYMVNHAHHHQHQQNMVTAGGLCRSASYDKLSFADVMQFADFGPKLGLNQAKGTEEEPGIDPVYFLKFPVLNERLQQEDDHDQSIMVPHHDQSLDENDEEISKEKMILLGEGDEVPGSENASVQLRFLGENLEKSPAMEGNKSTKRKRPRLKTSEEVESQRMTHIAVERNRRKQMNEHLRVLRSLMPGSYVQRGDQASIIGGAIEFVRELEQLLQCLESQKRRRLYGDAGPRPIGDQSMPNIQQPLQPQPQLFPPMPLGNDQMKLAEFEGLREETAECKSCLADVEVKLLGFDALIKILSRRRPGQLIKTIAALEDMQLNILHTNITTIDQTVLYSFNVKVVSETRFTAEDIANSVQQIFTFIHSSNSI